MSQRRPIRLESSLVAFTAALLLAALGLAIGGRAHGVSPHHHDADCALCHTAQRPELESDAARARSALRVDLEAECMRCHGDQGASHKTHVGARAGTPTTLPLGEGQRIECYTCHFLHGEDNRFGDYVRIDNRRGGLCLSCHTLAELQ